MIKTCLFDLGNVLLYFSQPSLHQQVRVLTGLSAEELERLLVTERLQEQYEAGAISTDHVFETIRRESPCFFTQEALIHAMSDIFTPNEDMLPVLRLLKKRGTRLVLVSNTNEAHMSFAMPRYECFRYFDELIFSYRIRAMKPERDFYVAAAQAALCDPGECLFTDDLAENIQGAESFGFKTTLFTGTESYLQALKRHGAID